MRCELLYGVLSHQGAFVLHEEKLRRLGKDVIRVFSVEDFEKVDALIIPGGESTTLIRFFNRLDLWDMLRNRINDGMAVFGTCAGLIMLAKEVSSNNQETLGVLDITVERMGYGRQIDSFEATINTSFDGMPTLTGIFIRAPRIVRVGKDVNVMATLDDEPVAVCSGRIWGTAFHPELTNNSGFHKRFIKMVESQ